MQSFVLDRHTDPSNPELKISQDDKIPVYDTVADAEAALANLADRQLISTKDEREIINAGSARPVTISQSSSINTIQFDTRFVIDAASAITVTLGSALYAGCTVTIINANAIRHSLAGTFLNNRIPPVMANCIITFVWTGTAWQMLSYQDNGDSTNETFTGRFWSDGKPIYKIEFSGTSTYVGDTSWTNISWANVSSLNVETLVNARVLDGTGSSRTNVTSCGTIGINGVNISFAPQITPLNITKVCIEYTKTTDSE